MRIISGLLKGTKLNHPGDIRPTTQKDKKIIFDTIRLDLPGASVADLYAGSGQNGLEALSLGANRVTFVENNPQNCQTIIENIDKCRVESDKYQISQLDVQSFIDQSSDKFNIIVADPPHFQVKWTDLYDLALIGQSSAIYVIKYNSANPPPDFPGLELIKTKGASDNRLNFYLKK